MGIMEKHSVEFITFQLQGNAKKLWRDYVECWSLALPSLSWNWFYALFIEKYMPHTLCNEKKNEFLALEQGSRSISDYKNKFHSFSRYATQLLGNEEEIICLFMKDLNTNLQVLCI